MSPFNREPVVFESLVATGDWAGLFAFALEYDLPAVADLSIRLFLEAEQREQR